MCRWLAYSGAPVLLKDLLYRPEPSLIVQSMHSTLGAEATNGDGFGVGWYEDGGVPGVFRSIEPAWNDRNLSEVATHVHSPRVFAHIRAAIGSPVQQTNCHPFRSGSWLFMHNGYIEGFHVMKRDLAMMVDPALFADIEGTTDTEMLFFLARTFGLEEDPRAAVARAIGAVEETGRHRSIAFPVQGTFVTTDGETTWAFRYSSEGRSRSLFVSTDVTTLREQHPDNPMLRELSDDARLIVSEPLAACAEPGVRSRSRPASSSAAATWRCPRSSRSCPPQSGDRLRPQRPRSAAGSGLPDGPGKRERRCERPVPWASRQPQP